MPVNGGDKNGLRFVVVLTILSGRPQWDRHLQVVLLFTLVVPVLVHSSGNITLEVLQVPPISNCYNCS